MGSGASIWDGTWKEGVGLNAMAGLCVLEPQPPYNFITLQGTQYGELWSARPF